MPSEFNNLPIQMIGPVSVVIVAMCFQFLIFVVACFMTYRIWIDVIQYLRDANCEKAKWIIAILGESELNGKHGKAIVKVAGTGLGITFVIIGVAVVAMWVVGNHTVT